MKKILILLGCAFLSGCDMLPMWGRTTQHMPIDTNAIHNVLIMGQSNAVRFSPNGINAFQTALGHVVSSVNCASDGTVISQWASTEILFKSCMAQMAQPDLIIFYQGESDSQEWGSYTTWAQQFTQMVNDVRTVKGNKQLPIIFMQIGHNPELYGPVPVADPTGTRWLHWDEVKAQQASVHIATTWMVSTSDLATDADEIHLTQASQMLLGQRMATTLSEN